jgi:hypothetical protein
MKRARSGARPVALAIAVVALLLMLPSTSSAQESFSEAWGPRYQSQALGTPPEPRRPRPPAGDALARLRAWHTTALDAVALDHTPVQPGETRTFGENFGPARTARALAIVQVATFEAVNAIAGGHRSYLGLARVPNASLDAAIAQASHDALAGVFPSQAPRFDSLLTQDLELIPNGQAESRGIALGRTAAASMLARRANDGSVHTEPRVGIEYITSDVPPHWQQDPISQVPLALGALWSQVRPFVIRSASQFRTPPPPPLGSADYAEAFEEVARLGGDGVVTPTQRNSDQTHAGTYWGYDGTPGLGTPPRMYNQIAAQIAQQRGSNVVQTARLFALINVALADAGLASWESKYFWDYWRPVTAVRRAAEDGNPATQPIADFTPLGAPASNLIGPNFTPPFPAYPSGHATFGGAVFGMLRMFYGTDQIPFTFVSDEYNGVTRDNAGNVRPRQSRSFGTLSQAEEENGQSRVYLGIHWSFDKTEGITQGRRVADFVIRNLFLPTSG